jgi:hypothetical protein
MKKFSVINTDSQTTGEMQKDMLDKLPDDQRNLSKQSTLLIYSDMANSPL